jgi:ERCC4-type nuclease
MPFNNIFRKTRQKLNRKTIAPLIIADVHEKNSLIIAELYSNKQIRLEVRPLKIGDYIIGEAVIERKTISDFITSMVNKRLIQQLRQMKKYKKQILIIEGDINEVYGEETPFAKATRGFILSIITNHSTPIIFTKDSEDTGKYLITLAKQQIKNKSIPSFHTRIPKTVQEQKRYVLESFPNIGPRKSEQLIDKFKTLKNTINADEEELKEILKSKTKDFKELIES